MNFQYIHSLDALIGHIFTILQLDPQNNIINLLQTLTQLKAKQKIKLSPSNMRTRMRYMVISKASRRLTPTHHPKIPTCKIVRKWE